MIKLFTYITAACAAVCLAGAAAAWWRLSHSNSDRGISTSKLKMAASATAISFGLMSAALALRVFDRLH